MIGLGALGFAAPWALAALALLPVLWWLLRATPPAPKRIPFPALRLLLDLPRTEETPARTPWWLLALRIAIAASVILAAAVPVWRADPPFAGNGPVLILVDNGWAAARHWPRRQAALSEALDKAEREGRSVVLLATAPRADGAPMAPTDPLAPAEARRRAAALAPVPWPVDRAAALRALTTAGIDGPATTLWIADGIADGGETALAERLQRMGPVRILNDPPSRLARLLTAPETEATGLRLGARRAQAGPAETMRVQARDSGGAVLARPSVTFAEGSREAVGRLDLPIEIRNRIARLQIEGEDGAGAAFLLDERWRRRIVGLVSGGPVEKDRPLLGDLFFLERALAPYAALRRGEIASLVADAPAAIFLADVGGLGADDRAALDGWIQGGGLLLRFAGPRLAADPDPLLPVRLRGPARSLGGAMSWAKPARLAPFPEDGPFAGLAISEEATVSRQVLAEPGPDLAAKTWARLVDGTPLVTAARRGEGWLVLMHVTANAAWTDLALSGLFVDMLRRLVALGRGAPATADTPLAPLELLDGFGRAGPPGLAAAPLPPGAGADTAAGPRHPPGYYGSEEARQALNLAPGLGELAPMAPPPPGVAVAPYRAAGAVPLKPWLLTLALLLFLADLVVGLALRGLLPVGRRAATTVGAAIAIAAVATLAGAARAQQPPADGAPGVPEAALETRLAYVVTGDRRVDAVSRAGLAGLSAMLRLRTAIEPGPPVGVDIERDELAFYPLLYWPLAEDQPAPSTAAARRLNGYLRHGGMIVFDRRRAPVGALERHAAEGALRRLADGLDLPPLTRVPGDHVLTRAFYLLQEFPGRWQGAPVWVAQGDSGVNDGVSPVVIGSHDWAAAWALDEGGRPLFATVPGGAEQREYAYRFGINLVMYALAGNYKSDQVHLPLIMERLGL